MLRSNFGKIIWEMNYDKSAKLITVVHLESIKEIEEWAIAVNGHLC